MYDKGIDLVVVNYRTPYDLDHFLRSLQSHPPDRGWQVTVVNVDPLDADAIVLAQWQAYWPDRLLALSRHENIGYARAVNWAVSLGNREMIGIFNADTRLTENVVNQCCDALRSDPSWAVVGPRQVDDKNRVTHGGIFGSNQNRQERGFHHRNSKAYSDVRDDAVSVSGSAYFIKRSVWDELTDCSIYQTFLQNRDGPLETHPGAFLPTPHYFEETFCSYHARAHGYKVVYYGPAVMVHQWHRASPRGGHADRKFHASREIFRDACESHGIAHE